MAAAAVVLRPMCSVISAGSQPTTSARSTWPILLRRETTVSGVMPWASATGASAVQGGWRQVGSQDEGGAGGLVVWDSVDEESVVSVDW